MPGNTSLASAVESAEFPRSTQQHGHEANGMVPPSSFVPFDLQIYRRTDQAILCYKAAPVPERSNYLSKRAMVVFISKGQSSAAITQAARSMCMTKWAGAAKDTDKNSINFPAFLSPIYCLKKRKGSRWHTMSLESLPCCDVLRCVGSAPQFKGPSQEAGAFLAVFWDIGKLLGHQRPVEWYWCNSISSIL